MPCGIWPTQSLSHQRHILLCIHVLETLNSRWAWDWPIPGKIGFFLHSISPAGPNTYGFCPALASPTLWRPGCMWKGGKGAEWTTVAAAAGRALEKDDTEAFLSSAWTVLGSPRHREGRQQRHGCLLASKRANVWERGCQNKTVCAVVPVPVQLKSHMC